MIRSGSSVYINITFRSNTGLNSDSNNTVVKKV